MCYLNSMEEFSSYSTSVKIQKVTKLKMASSSHRLMAGLFDFAVLLLASVIICIPAILVLVDALTMPSKDHTYALTLIMFLTGGFVSLADMAYKVAIPYFNHGQTLGLRFFKLQMLSEEGEEVSLKFLLVRAFSSLFLTISTLGLYYLVEVYSLFASPSHRDFADTISKTIVVELDDEI
jgi:uncharacterized RDD family membrane protein YckC